MSTPDFMSAEWWNDVVAEAFAEIDPIMVDAAETLFGAGYSLGASKPSWERLLRIAALHGQEYAAEVLRRMLANPTTSKDAAELVKQTIRGAA